MQGSEEAGDTPLGPRPCAAEQRRRVIALLIAQLHDRFVQRAAWPRRHQVLNDDLLLLADAVGAVLALLVYEPARVRARLRVTGKG